MFACRIHNIKITIAKLERDGFGLSAIQMDALESAQRSKRRADDTFVREIQLHDFVAVNRAGIRYIHRYADGVFRRTRRRRRHWGDGPDEDSWSRQLPRQLPSFRLLRVNFVDEILRRKPRGGAVRQDTCDKRLQTTFALVRRPRLRRGRLHERTHAAPVLENAGALSSAYTRATVLAFTRRDPPPSRAPSAAGRPPSAAPRQWPPEHPARVARKSASDRAESNRYERHYYYTSSLVQSSKAPACNGRETRVRG